MAPSGTGRWLALVLCLTILARAAGADTDPGFSAILKSNMDVKRAGWTELTGWSTNASSVGLYETGSGLNSANGRYSPPKSGIYLVSASVTLDNASPYYMRLVLAVNNVLNVNNGMHSMEGRPSATQYTMTVNGAMEILAGERISVYLYSSSDSSYTVLNDSSFSVRFLGLKESGPGFLADVSYNTRYRTTGWQEVKNYRIYTSNTGMFTEGDGFSTSTGRFTAPCSGAYFVSANIRLDQASGSFFRLLVAVNGNTTLENGLHAIRGNPTSTYYTMNVAGVVKLTRGDYVSVWVYSYQDTYWYVQGESGFSVVFLNDLSQLSAGVHADQNKDISITKAGNSEVTGWLTSGTRGLFTTGRFSANTGKFTVPTDGAYFVSAQVRLDSVSGMVKAFISVNGKEENIGLQHTWESPPSNYFTLTASGIVWLKTGQVVSSQIYSKTDNNFAIQQQSGFSVHSLQSTGSWSAVHTRLVKTVISTSNTWTDLKGWTSKGNNKGLFVAGSSFDATTGRYILALAGIYFVSANVQISNDGGTMTRLSVAVNGVASSTAGLTAVRENPTSKTYTLSVAGFLQLDNGQNISLQLLSGSTSQWSVESTSDFVVSFVCGSLSVPAFSVNLASDTSFTSSGWQEVKGYSVTGSKGLFQSRGSNLNVVTGRFTAPIAGVYLVVGNAEILLGGGDFYRCAIIVNANTGVSTNGLQSTTGEPKDSRFTCHVAGTVTLSVGDQLSLWIYSLSDSNWKLGSGTTVGAVYVGPSVTVRSVLAATNTDVAVTTSGWKELTAYTTSGGLQFLSGTDFVSSTGRYTAPKQGLYYVSAQVNVLGATSSDFALRLAVSGDTASDGPYSIWSSPSSKYLSLTIVGIVKLEAGQYVSLYVNPKDDSSWKIAANSGFSVTAVSTVPQTPGAITFVSSTKNYRQTAWVEITTYKLTTKTGLYQTGINNSLTTNGRFYAPTDGIYFVSANIRLDYATGSHFRGVIAINGKTDTSNGLHSRRGYPPSYYYTINVAGSVSLSANDYVSLFIESASDTSWNLNTESSFSVRFLSYVRPAVGFLADVLVDKNYIGSTALGWTEINNWRTSGSTGLFSHGAGFDGSKGQYTIQKSGIYIVAANIELSGAYSGTFQVRAVVDRNVAKSSNGMVSVRQSTPNNYYTFSLAGAMYLTKGQTLSIYVYSQLDTNWKLSHESGFSVAYHSPYQYVPGFHAVLGSTKTVTTAYWKEITGWQTPTTGAGLFRSSNDFDTFTGRFTVPYSGEYFVSANVRLDYAALPSYRYYRLLVIVNGVLSFSTNIVQSITSSTPNSYTLAASGVLRLKKWDYISLWIYNYYDTNWRISADSGFSAIFMGGDDQPERCLDNGPKFVLHPAAVSKKVGSDVTLSCRAVGSPAPTYQWTFAGKSIVGATEANYTLTNVSKSNTGDYRCVATVGSVISKTSNSARLTVYDPQPKFDKTQYAFSLTENGFRNRYIGLVRARADTSSGRSQSLTFTLIAGDPSNNFTLRSYTTVAYLYVRGTLDREMQSSFNLTVKTVNRAQTTLSATVTVTVTVLDENDNSPVFSQAHYNANVTENVPVGTTVTQIMATDADATTNAKLTYSILSGNDNGAFAIDSSTGYVVTANAIDRERQIDYLLFVDVTDNPTTSLPRTNRTSLRITVLDTNDNAPTFSSSIYSQTVSEGAVVGTNILQVAAYDVDTGTNSQITFTITGGNNGTVFGISSADGIVTVDKSLDRETVASYRLILTATDGGTPAQTSNAVVQVTVSDVNDNAPTFSLSSYRTSVRENLPSGTAFIKVSASEKDTGSISVITYSIDNSVNSSFAIHSKTGQVTTVRSFDREVTSQYVFTVYAADSAASPRTGSATVTVSVADENDNTPSFSKSLYQVTVQETIGIGARVLQISASDNDFGKNGNVTYSFSSGDSHFVLDSLTGIIRTDSNLDFVTQSSYSLVAVAKDGGIAPNSASASVIVNITDVNNNAPVFGKDEYNVTTPESAAVGKVLVTVRATDGDAGKNAKVTYSIAGGNVGNKFYIDPNKGELQIAASLDYETIDSYSLTVEATDGGRPQQTALTLVGITVSDVNDNSPVFTQILYVTTVSSLVPNGTLIATVQATDSDSGPYGRITYSLQTASSYFRINRRSGGVYTITRLLGLSQQQTAVSLQIAATDGGNPGKVGQSVLTVSIVRDQASALTFSVTTYTASVSENATLRSTVLIVQASSQDSTVASSVSYNISNPLNAAPFQINSNTGDITVKTSLDRESTSGYAFVVQAQAGKQTARANVRIRLVDVNDNSPIFSPVSYSTSTPDTTPVGTTILQVTATDKDIGSNKRITFSLTGRGRGDFTIDSASGSISTASILNSTAVSSYVLMVTAMDGGNPSLSSSARVSVNINATVNQPPRFASAVYTFVAAEDVPGGSLIGYVQAYDRDVAPLNKVTYKIQSVSVVPFVIDTNSGKLKTIRQLDYETKSTYALTVIATDSGSPARTATALVSIIITDVNDNLPVFSKASYQISVSDALPIGSSVLQVTATDNDSGTNGQLFFSISKGNSDKFHMDATSGLLSLSGKLDRTVVDSYVLQVTAQDSGVPSQTASSVVTISVVDVIALRPIFTRTSYTSQVREDGIVGSPVVTVAAREGSSSGQTDNIRYALSGLGANQFAINADTGRITVAQALDREYIPSYTLTVVATDRRVPPQSASVPVIVTILDVNDNLPTFTSTSYQATVSESADVGVPVVTVQATDRDSGENGRIVYSITNGNGNSAFKINSVTGLISTQTSLDRELIPKYVLRVTASDQGAPRRSAVITVVVAVTDVNDHSPSFDQPVYNQEMREDTRIGTAVLAVSARDGDLGNNALLTYSITSESALPFTISPSTGGIVTSNNLQSGIYRFTVVASDNGSPSRSGSCEVVVTVQDINDHRPVFVTGATASYESIIHSSIEVGAVILTVTATDDDQGQNGQIRYSIQSDDGELPFRVAATTGAISLIRNVVDKQTFTFNVVATDGAAVGLNSSIQVTILVNDQVALSQPRGSSSGSDNTAIIVGGSVGAVAAILLIAVLALLVMKKRFAFKWASNDDDFNVSSSVAYNSESPDNLAFSNPIYADTASSSKENALYQPPVGQEVIETKSNPLYSSTDELDRIQAELQTSLGEHFSTAN